MAERRRHLRLADPGIFEDVEHTRVHEHATPEDLALLRKQIIGLADEGSRYAFTDKSAPTSGYFVVEVPKELVPKDAMTEFNPGKPVNLEINFNTRNGAPTVEFSQMYSVSNNSQDPLRLNTRVHYSLTGEGQRSVEQNTINQVEHPFGKNRKSFITKGAVAQIATALEQPRLHPPKPAPKR